MELFFQFSLGILGAVFGAGVVYATMRLRIAKAQSDANRIGDMARKNDRKSERRWLHGIATQIETSATLEEAKIYARQLKEDAWATKAD